MSNFPSKFARNNGKFSAGRVFEAGLRRRGGIWKAGVLAGAVALAVQGGAAMADSGMWTGTGPTGNWVDTANWVGGIVAGTTTGTTSTDTATINGDASSVGTINIDAGRNIMNLTIAATGTYTIGSTTGNALLLSDGGTIVSTTTNASNETINAPLVLEGSSYTFTNLSTGGLGGGMTYGGTISGGSAVDTVLMLGLKSNTISGVISDGSATHLSIVKTGSWTFSAADTYTGSTTMTGGTFILSGQGALVNSLAISGTSSITTSSSLTLNYNTLGANSVDRLNNSATVTMANGFALIMTLNTTAAATTSEVIGGLVIDNGNAFVTMTNVTPAATDSLVVGSGGFTRNNFATALVRGGSLGLAAGTAGSVRVSIDGTNGTGLLQIGSAKSSVGTAGGGTSTNLAIIPYLMGDTSQGGAGTNFLTYDQNASNGGLRLLATGEQVAIASATTGVNAKSTGTVTLSAGSRTFNSLLLNATTGGQVTSLTGGAADTLTITSGALADVATQNTGTGSISGFSSIVFGGTSTFGSTNEAIITNSNSLAAFTVGSPINTASAGGGLTKTGLGPVVLSAANLYTGQTTINQGILQLGNGTTGSISAATTVVVTPQGGFTLGLPDGGIFTGTIVDNGNSTGLTSGPYGVSKADFATTNTITSGISGIGGVGISSATVGNVLAFSETANSYTGATTILNGTLRFVGDVMSPASSIAFSSTTITNPVLQLRADTDTTFQNGGVVFTGSTLALKMTIDVNAATSATGKNLSLPGTFSVTGYTLGPTINVTGGNGYALVLGTFDLTPKAAGALPIVNVSGAGLRVSGVTVGTGGGISTGLQFTGTGNTEITGDLTRATDTSNLTLTQNGAGSLTLSGSAATTTVTGSGPAGYTFNLQSGSLNINSSTALGAGTGADGLIANEGIYFRTLNISGGTTLDNTSMAAVTEVGDPNVNVGGDFTFGGSNGLNLGLGAVVLNGTAGLRTITVNGTRPLELGGAVAAGTASGIDKEGSGVLVLSGANTYGNSTIVGGGTLLVNNTSGSGTGSGQVVMNGGVLGGSGSIGGAVVAGSGLHTIAPSATLPTGVATLTISSLTTSSGTTLAFKLVSPGTYDSNGNPITPSVNDGLNITTSGGLSLGSSTLAIAAGSTTGIHSVGYYKLVQYAGTIGGGGLSSLAVPVSSDPEVVYSYSTVQDPGYIDLHKGFVGDANDDGVVNFTDFISLASDFGQPGDWGQGDFNGDGIVNFTDFIALAANFGQTIGGASETVSASEVAEFNAAASSFFGSPSSVPEPTSLALMGLGAVALLKRRRKV